MSLEEVRGMLYEILTADDGDGQDNVDPVIRATQKMGVSLSSAVVKEGGVRIFQLQNVVQQKVIKNVVAALRLIDRIPLLPILETVPEVEDQPKSLGEEIEEALDNEVGYPEFLAMVGRQFVHTAIARNDNSKETAAAIKISYSKLMQVKRSTS